MPENSSLALLGTAVIIAIASCGGPSDAPAAKVCDPLADNPQPIVLGRVIGAGRDAGGVVYMVDRPEQGERLFISDGMALKRQPITGSAFGSIVGSGTFTIVNSGSGDTELHVEIDTDVAGVPTMGILRGPLETKIFPVGIRGETLTLLGRDALAGYMLVNLSGTIYVEYVATFPDGRTMVVTRPDVDWSYSDFRLFMSDAATSLLRERKVGSVVRGSFTDIVFDLDGTQAKARFTSSL
ncbi:MAG TPA: hypothetical protein VHU40_03140, partial [Polyangia bacterium]|nr:hypothetical protein [Polyangia bacterium]